MSAARLPNANTSPGRAISTARSIAELLGGRKTGRGFVCCCPPNDASTPSLSIADGDRGLLVHCFVGCKPADIFDAMRRLDPRLMQSSSIVTEPSRTSEDYQRSQHAKANFL